MGVERVSGGRAGRYAYATVLVLIVLLGAVLRTYDLSGVPGELIVDEIDLYNSAHSIVTTGHDIDGTLLPFLYSPFTRNPPMYAVAGYFSTLVFGKTAFGWRFPAVVFGLAAIVLIYLITLELTKRRSIALVAAFLQATAPIFIHFSRIGWEPAAELPFLLAGLYCLLRGSSLQSLAPAATLLGLACYTYMAGWFYAIVLAGAALALNVQNFRSRRSCLNVACAALIWLAVSLPALCMLFLDPSTAGKTARIATFSYGVTLESLRIFAVNYAAHFRWSYLVTTGDPIPAITWRYLDGFGAFFWWVIPLAFVGAAFGYRYLRERWMFIWLWLWLAVYPLGGALTNEGAPNAPRTLAGAPVFCIFAAIGVALLFDFAASLRSPRLASSAKQALRAAFSIAACVSVALFCRFYFVRYVHVDSNAWDSGTRAMFAAIRSRASGYQRVCFSVRPAWYGIDAYDRFYLGDVPLVKIDTIDSPACSLPATLLVTDSDRHVVRADFMPIASIRDVDGNPFAVVLARPLRQALR